MKRYLAPFSVMEEWMDRQPNIDERHIDLGYDEIIDFIRRMLTPTAVDDAWYCATYPGVAAAVANGVFGSAADHFIQHGYFEGKQPFEYETSDLIFPPPFPAIKQHLPVYPTRRGFRVSVTRDDLIGIARRYLAVVPVDAAWYCDRYPGIADAILSGKIDSAKTHFAEHGYFEGRMPFAMDVDEEWYLNSYRDVARAIADGTVKSAQDHFMTVGYGQGRLPRQL